MADVFGLASAAARQHGGGNKTTAGLKKLQDGVQRLGGVKNLVGVSNLLSSKMNEIEKSQKKREDYEAKHVHEEKERIAKYLRMPQMLGEDNIKRLKA